MIDYTLLLICLIAAVFMLVGGFALLKNKQKKTRL